MHGLQVSPVEAARGKRGASEAEGSSVDNEPGRT